jgi:hypothetical protein
MNVIFTELFNIECKDKLNIPYERVQEALINPDAQQTLKLDDLELCFFIKQGDAIFGNKRILLVCSRKENESTLIDFAFIVPLELIDSDNIIEPLIILQELVQKFGLMIRIGNQINKFIFNESIPIDMNNPDMTKIIEITNPLNHSFMQQGSVPNIL